MKCPKCNYLGFETGDRCKNCGYDFSLLTENAARAASTDADLSIAAVAERDPLKSADLVLRDPDQSVSRPSRWNGLEHRIEPAMPEELSDPLGPMPLDTIVALPPSSTVASRAKSVGEARAASRAAAPSLPLFQPGADQDEPLIKLPAAPRPPLAVRRTPDRPRPRTVPKAARRVSEAGPVAQASGAPALQFPDDLTPRAATDADAAPVMVTAHPTAETSSVVRRLVAAAIDHGILLAVDVIVVYFTLKMAALAPGDWRMLPPVPLAAFLGMVKVAYFCAFTLVGGQTIGKMAVRIRVVGDDGADLDPARAIQRTLAGTLSFLAAGLGFLPVLIADDRRGVHDHVARTRVIALPSGRHPV